MEFVGKKYNREVNLSIKEICSLIRKEIREQKKHDEILAKAKISVRKRNYNAIAISINGIDFEKYSKRWLEYKKENNVEYYTPSIKDFRYCDILSDEYNHLKEKLKEIGNYWNFDNSDPMTDYFHANYYLSIID